MKKLLPLYLIFFTLCSCTDATSSTPADKPLSFGDMPNAESRYIVFKTEVAQSDGLLLKNLEQTLHKDRFSFKKNVELEKYTTSFNSCKNNTVLKFEGNGIEQYYAKSKVSEKSMKNTYADFTLTIFTFPNEKTAIEQHSAIDKALYSRDFCNGKDPSNLLQKDNKIYYFTTRAELFRGYVLKYGNTIKNFKP